MGPTDAPPRPGAIGDMINQNNRLKQELALIKDTLIQFQRRMSIHAKSAGAEDGLIGSIENDELRERAITVILNDLKATLDHLNLEKTDD